MRNTITGTQFIGSFARQTGVVFPEKSIEERMREYEEWLSSLPSWYAPTTPEEEEEHQENCEGWPCGHCYPNG